MAIGKHRHISFVLPFMGLNFEKTVGAENLNQDNQLPEMRMFDCRFLRGHVMPAQAGTSLKISPENVTPEYLPTPLKRMGIGRNA